MALTNNHIQLYRNNTLGTSLEGIKTTISGLTNIADGTPVLGRYTVTVDETTEQRTVLGIKQPNGSYQWIEGANSIAEYITAAINELDSTGTSTSNGVTITVVQKDGKITAATLSNVDNAVLKDYSKGSDATAVLVTDTIAEAIAKLENQIDAVAGQDSNITADANKYFTKIAITDSELDSTASTTANIDTAQIVDYAAQEGGFIAATDTIHGAFKKVENKILGMDLAEVTSAGTAIVSVSETDGVVSASYGDIAAEHVTVADSGSLLTATTVEAALAEIATKVNANEVTSTGKTINITTANSKTNLEVNIDGTTIVKDGTSGVISSNLKILKETSGLDTNVKEQYKLVYGDSTTAIGEVVKIYKDSSLKEVYLGSSADTINASTGTITKNTVTDPQSMNFAYQLADGTYSLTKIDVSKFLTESEFSDGLDVNGGVVSVKVDSTSEKVVTGASASGDVLSVSSGGVKVSNIQNAIDYAVSQSSISAAGDDYITAAVDEDDNKKINVTADVQNLSATAGAAGTYNATTGAQTAAPTAGTLTGTAKSLADGADIASKVKTYVDGAIAIEGARSDAKNTADIYALNSTAGTTSVGSGKHVAVQVAEAAGKLTAVTVTESDIASASDLTKATITAVTANDVAGTVTTGANGTSIATSISGTNINLGTAVDGNVDGLKATNNVQEALATLYGKINANAVSSSDESIKVTPGETTTDIVVDKIDAGTY